MTTPYRHHFRDAPKRHATRLLRGMAASMLLVLLVVALPWALWHFIGNPLPTPEEVKRVVSGPVTSAFLLDALACATWLAWALFTLDVVRCALDLAREVRLPSREERRRHTVATVLVGTVLVSLLGNRAALADRGTTHHPAAVVTASSLYLADPVAAEPSAGGKRDRIKPYDPHTGVHDSLWRMAERTLGDGNRWPEIFELNRGKPQPGGHVLTSPSLVFEGEEMLLPDDAVLPAAVTPEPRPAPPEPPPADTSRAPHTSTVPTTPRAPAVPTADEPTSNPDAVGFHWGTELFVGLGLAAAVSSALLTARRRHRAGYRPGSGDRTDLPVAPVVYQLRLAHLRATTHANTQDPPDTPPQGGLPIGVLDDREAALDVAAARGLGLVGPGAQAALRALLITALTTPRRQHRVVIPEEDVNTLLGRRLPAGTLPTGLVVTADLDTALDAIEHETLQWLTDPEPPHRVLLVASVPQRSQRLQAVLDSGSTSGVTGLLLGQCPNGVTAYIRDDGTISSTTPGAGEHLRGARAFELGADHLADLLALLGHAHTPHPATDSTTPRLEILEPDTPTTSDAPAPAPLAHQSGGAGTAVGTALRVRVFGLPRIWWHPDGHEARDITSALQPRVRELLVFLVLHPDGASRDGLVNALWPHSAPHKTTSAMNSSLSRLRRALLTATDGAVPDPIIAEEGRYHLNRRHFDADYWHFADAVARRRTATTAAQRTDAHHSIVEHYVGPLADGLDAEWIEPVREGVRRDAIDAVAALARALVDDDPQRTLDLLEIARGFDPHNELVYRDIMRLQDRLGRHDAVPRTLTLLASRLAEIGERPTPETVDLANRLRRRLDGVVGEAFEKARR